MKSRVRSVVRASDVIVAMVALIAVLLAACSGDTTDEPDVATTTTVTESAASSGQQDGQQDVEFGRGQLPATVPADFPIPDQAVVGSTMVDRIRDLTEAVVIYPADVPEVVRYYETNLPELGYTIDESSGTEANWTIEFSTDASSGELRLSVGGASLTQGVLRVVTPVSG